MNTSENTGEAVPFDLSKAAAAATEELLPSKSKERNEKQFQIFEDWRRLKNVTSLTEDVFLAYFAEKSSSYKASSLWSTYSMLKAVLLLKENLDISKFCKVTAYLKRKSTGYQPKKSKCLSRDQIDKFLLEAPDKEFLVMKVALIFGVSGACRCDELSRMLVDDIEDQNNVLIVHIPDSKTKKSRRFVVVDERNLATYRRYLELRPPSTPHKRLFLNYKKGKCTVQPVGLHSFGNLLEDVKQLCLKEGKDKLHGIFIKKNGLAVKASVEIGETIKVIPKMNAGFSCMIIGAHNIIKFTAHRHRIIVTLTRNQSLTIYLKRDSSYYRQKHLQPVDLLDTVTFMMEELTPSS
ncbi:hypothetical protein Zmor_017159 [Zophobas morio]|uniref:Uncharacterized protein n=1 Tax=Zophobas morio TaxID=2755281 RepID=A0AA38MCB0_9CUCU|nr:hypothetical protein Zmor_017159 [Zophobas morio]